MSYHLLRDLENIAKIARIRDAVRDVRDHYVDDEIDGMVYTAAQEIFWREVHTREWNDVYPELAELLGNDPGERARKGADQ